MKEESYEDLQEKLQERCKEAGIEFEICDLLDGTTFTAVFLPNGRETRRVPFSSSSRTMEILEQDFEKYVFLGDYAAVASYEDHTIEALIRPVNSMPRSFLYRKLFGELEEGDDIEPIVISKEVGNKTVTIEINKSSETLQALMRGPYKRDGMLSVKITGLKISQHNHALEYLQKISDSLFFQVDLQNNLGLSLVRDKRPSRRGNSAKTDFNLDIQFPEVEFDQGPISLYWYARNSIGMPLLQFLAYYQVIEYYYPTYSKKEAKRRIQTILKDPTFRKDRDADIGRVLTAISGTGKGFGDERSQLRATISECIAAEDLREFYTEFDERKEFFSAKQKRLTDHKIPIPSKDADLRNPTADLIYDIRCKIVHTKGDDRDGEVELLLPFTKEAELLYQDLELMQFVARKVLIAACTELTL